MRTSSHRFLSRADCVHMRVRSRLCEPPLALAFPVDRPHSASIRQARTLLSPPSLPPLTMVDTTLLVGGVLVLAVAVFALLQLRSGSSKKDDDNGKGQAWRGAGGQTIDPQLRNRQDIRTEWRRGCV